MLLTKTNLAVINSTEIVKPNKEIFELPEKVLQFGTGVLLRGLPDYFIDCANREGVFNGRIVMVKSTTTGSLDDYKKQDNLYTLHVKGVSEGREIDESVICSSISRVISATDEWAEVLKVAHNPELQVVLSNTTEAGIELVVEPISGTPPLSFPAKLLAVLYERFTVFNGDNERGLVIIPTELIINNAKKLRSIILELAYSNKLTESFITWIINANYFCDSLVDRIVPGKPAIDLVQQMNRRFGYEDNLRIIAENYCLWAIEGNQKVSTILSFSKSHKGVVVAKDIEVFRELKLRLLNGAHTLTCAVAVLSGFTTVKQAMENKTFTFFISKLMLLEITPAIPYELDIATAEEFASQVLDRFRNPNIEHLWLSISAEYSLKIKTRIIPLLLNHYQKSDMVPECIVVGFAAFIRFMKISKDEERHFGCLKGERYPVNDSLWAVFYYAWQNIELKKIVNSILSSKELWETDLTVLPGFENAVTINLEKIIYGGTLQLLKDMSSK